MTLLWSEREDAQARQSLRQTIAVTRRAFLAVNLDVLQADAETVAINLGSLQTDVVAFSRLARNTQPADLEAAAALYTGDFLAHFQVRDACAEDWITVRRTELQTLLARCLGSLMSGYQRLEQHDDVERIAARILEFDAYDEEAHRALMTVHLARGQRSLAFRQLQRCRESLLRDLSVRPAAETEALIKRTVPEPITDFSTAGNGRVEVFSRKSISPVRAVAQNALARGPSLIVTPFEVLGDGARAELLAYGLVEDIVVNLSRFSGLFVVPPGPAVSLNLHPIDPVI